MEEREVERIECVAAAPGVEAPTGVFPPPIPPTDEKAAAERRAALLGLPLARRDTLMLVLLTAVADLCLYREGGGAGGAVLLLAVVAALMGLRGGRSGWWQAGAGLVAAALAGVLVWSAWWLAAAVAVVGVFVMAVRLWAPDWSLLDCLWGAAKSVAYAPARLWGHVAASRSGVRSAARPRLPARVIVIPAVVSIAFLIVFAAANPVVARQVGRAWRQIVDVVTSLEDYLNLGRGLFWAAWLLVFAALIRPVVRVAVVEAVRTLDVAIKPGDDTIRAHTNYQAAFVTLVCVNAMFLAYNAMDAVYLYLKATLPAGISWTAYTHSGCKWLTFGLFLSTVVLGVIFWGDLNFHPRAARLKRLAGLWIALNAVLAVGTLRRIAMYIDYSGLTHLLLTGVYGSLLVMAGVVIMAVKVWRNHNAVWLLRRYAAAFAVGVTALALTPHGYVCARYNVPRVLAGKPHATWPLVLKNLRADALPPLVALLGYRRADGDAAKERLVREGIAAILGQQLERLEWEDRQSWTRWQVSHAWARQRLRAVRPRLEEIVPRDRWSAAHRRLKSDYDLSGAP